MGADNPDGIEDDSFVEMMVFADHDSRKLIVAFARYSGEIYIKMTHNSEPVEGYNSLGWRRVYTTSVLFEGELRKDNQSICQMILSVTKRFVSTTQTVTETL